MDTPYNSHEGEWTTKGYYGIIKKNKKGGNQMRKATVDEKKKCPKCERIEHQIKVGYNDSGTQRCKCKICGIRYTIDPKKIAYPEEIKQAAIKAYYSGVSGRGVGHLFHINKANVYNWIKKTK